MSAPAPRPPPRLPSEAHKGTAGRVLCVVGSAAMPGAAILVVRAAQRAGAGLVTLGCLDRELASVVPPAAPETVLLDLSQSLDPLRKDGERFDSRVAGCGLGALARTTSTVEMLLKISKPIVLDADALNVLAGEPERLRSSSAPVVITPHPLEGARLLGGKRIGKDESSRADAARELARRSGSICCLKGHHTVVTDGSDLFVNATGNPGMATAGTGDVLSGILAAYLALGALDSTWRPIDAARGAVYVHGLAGDLAAAELGQRALIASDLIAFLPAAQRRWEEKA